MPSRPVPKNLTFFPFLRIDIVALKILVEELRHVDQTVTIETDTLKDIESVDALVGLKPASLRGLRIGSSARSFGEDVSISIPGGRKRAFAFYRPDTDESRSKAEVYLRVCALLDHLCAKGPLRALTVVRYLVVFAFGLFISRSITDFNSHHKGLNPFLAITLGIIIGLNILQWVLLFSERTKLNLVEHQSWWKRSSDLIIGTTIATVVGTLIATLILRFT